MLAVAAAGPTYNVTRGIEGSTPAAHANGDVAAVVVTAASLKAMFGNINAVGTYAGLPAAPIKPGRVYHPTDGFGGITHDSGSAFTYLFQDTVVTPPVVGTYTLTGTGPAFTDGTKGGIIIAPPAQAGPIEIKRVVKTIGIAAPYTISWIFTARLTLTNTVIVGVEDNGGQLVVFGLYVDATGVRLYHAKHNSGTSYNSNYQDSAYPQLNSPHFELKLADDGTNRNWYARNLGQPDFHLFFSEGRTDFLTATKYFAGVQAPTTGNAPSMWLRHNSIA
jgi:hypothetical protein